MSTHLHSLARIETQLELELGAPLKGSEPCGAPHDLRMSESLFLSKNKQPSTTSETMEPLLQASIDTSRVVASGLSAVAATMH